LSDKRDPHFFLVSLLFPLDFPTFVIGCGMIDHADFSVVVKNRGAPPKSWRWEIYRAGRRSPIEQSKDLFESMTEANRAGKVALRLLLTEFPD
jgi:hypothetical protein